MSFHRIKPILFNTEMVKAILDGRKTVTRRVIKPRYRGNEIGFRIDRNMSTEQITGVEIIDDEECGTDRYVNPPYQIGDILYVRETWAKIPGASSKGGFAYKYKASKEGDYWNRVKGFKWKPSIHMPKEAARIWLKVTDVRVERLQDIMDSPHGKDNQVIKEGCDYGCDFVAVWDSTIKKQDLDSYGWDANPWVFVVSFEKIEKEKL